MAILRGGARRPNDIALQIDRFVKEARGLTLRTLQAGARRFKSRMLSERLSGRPGLRRITGHTRSTLQSRVEKLANSYRWTARIGDRQTPGIRAHEYGATIYPKRAKYLRFKIKYGRHGGVVDKWVTVRSVTIPPRLNFHRILGIEERRTMSNLRRDFQALARRKRK